jgi:hypothetical protein
MNFLKQLFYMKTRNVLLILAMFIIAVSANAQDKTNYIIVKTINGEVASFYPAAVERQFIENNNWVFELKTGTKYSYPLADVQPFTIELRAPNSGTGVQPVIAGDWRVYDDGSNLVIENPGGSVGSYAVYNISGRLIKTGYESGSKVSIQAPPGVCIVKAGTDVQKAVKK